jgi:hypothetical protein
LNRTRLFVAVLVCFGAVASAFAHQPVLVSPEDGEIRVELPEVSQAFYGELRGRETRFVITSEKPYRLQVELLAPAISGSENDLRAEIRCVETGLLAMLEKPPGQWTRFYERFAGDVYYRGPEFAKDVPAGDYEIIVSNPRMQGKYVLAVGEREVFTVRELLRALVLLPTLKHDYFGTSWVGAFWNRGGLIVFVTLALAASTVPVACFILHRVRTRMRFLSMRRAALRWNTASSSTSR